MEMRQKASVTKAAAAAFVAPAGACVAAVIAIVALVARWRDSRAIDGVEPTAMMVPATALGVLLAATAVVLVRARPGAVTRAARCIAAVAALAPGVFGIVHYAAGWEAGPGIPWWARPPSPMTGLGLTLIGTALLVLGARYRWAIVGASMTLVVALVGLVGHAYGADLLYGLNPWGGVSVTTAVALSALAVGAIFSDPSRGIAALSVSDSSGGHLLRRLLPAALLAPLVLGWLALAVQNAELIDAAYATALLIVSLIVLGVGYVVHQAKLLHAADAERKLAEEKLRESEARFRALAENASMAVFVIDEASRIEFANPAVEQIFGYTIEEMLGQSLDMLMPPDQRPRHDAGMRQYLETGRRNIAWEGVELPGLAKNGR